MRTCKRLAAFLLAVMMILTLIPVSSQSVAADSYTINKTSATIEIGKTVTLKMMRDGTAVSAMWASDDTSVATVSSSGVVTGKSKGSATITGIYNGFSVSAVVSVVRPSTTSITRYNVLVLDCSASMRGVPMARQKTATKRFANTVLKADGNNYVAVVSLNDTSAVECGFTSSYSRVCAAINSLTALGHTNMKAAFDTAYSLMNSKAGGKNVIKNVVLCSDGLPNYGTTQISGKYTKADHKFYARANAVYSVDTRMKSAGLFIYALGAFHNSKGDDLVFGRRFMKDLASKDKYYVISNPDEMDDVFDDIADAITSVSLSDSSITLYVGESKTLTPYLNGNKTTAKWKIDNSSIASVSSSGKVTGKKAGTAKVTATFAGKTLTCRVTVKTKAKIRLRASSIVLQVGEKYVMKPTVTGTKNKVQYISNKPEIASVSSSGVVTGLKVGVCYVFVKVDGVTAKCKVTVKRTSQALYAMYFSFPSTKFNKTGETINQEGDRIAINDSGVIEKAAAYVYRSGSYWYVTLAFKGFNNTVTSAMIYAYVAYNGKIVRDASSYSGLNKFYMYKDSDGIWSLKGKYSAIKYNVTDTNGNIVSNASAKKTSSNMKIFTNLESMKKYLKSN